jgi:preprotein translocase subunit SecE
MSKVKKREELIRKLLIITMYIAVIYKLYYLPQIHIIFEALLNGREGFKPYLVVLGIIIVLGLVHKGINWVFLKANR